MSGLDPGLGDQPFPTRLWLPTHPSVHDGQLDVWVQALAAASDPGPHSEGPGTLPRHTPHSCTGWGPNVGSCTSAACLQEGGLWAAPAILEALGGDSLPWRAGTTQSRGEAASSVSSLPAPPQLQASPFPREAVPSQDVGTKPLRSKSQPRRIPGGKQASDLPPRPQSLQLRNGNESAAVA